MDPSEQLWSERVAEAALRAANELRALDDPTTVDLADDALDVGVDVSAANHEVARVRANRVVVPGRDLDRLDALDIGALARDRVGADDVLERRVEVLQLLVHDAEKRLVARSTHLTLLAGLTHLHRKTSCDGNRP